MEADTNAVLVSIGDMLLQLGSDAGWVVENTPINSKSLNQAVAAYQARLDAMDLEISRALENVRFKIDPILEPEPEIPAPEPEAKEEIDLTKDDWDGGLPDADGNEIQIDLSSPNDAFNAGEFDFTQNMDMDLNSVGNDFMYENEFDNF